LSLFFYGHDSHIVYILGYVDDIIIIGSFIPLLRQITHSLHSHFSLKQLGKLDYFLGIEINYQFGKSLVLT